MDLAGKWRISENIKAQGQEWHANSWNKDRTPEKLLYQKFKDLSYSAINIPSSLIFQVSHSISLGLFYLLLKYFHELKGLFEL